MAACSSDDPIDASGQLTRSARDSAARDSVAHGITIRVDTAWAGTIIYNPDPAGSDTSQPGAGTALDE